MIEVKVKGNEVSVIVGGEDGEGFLTECTAAVHALAGAISEKEGVNQSVALKSLCVIAGATEDIFDTHRHRTVVRMPRGVKRDAND